MDVSSRREEQMSGVHENFRALVEEYDRWMNLLEEWQVPMVRYNFEDIGASDFMVGVVKDFWEKRR
jgi:hypothetical protein